MKKDYQNMFQTKRLLKSYYLLKNNKENCVNLSRVTIKFSELNFKFYLKTL